MKRNTTKPEPTLVPRSTPVLFMKSQPRRDGMCSRAMGRTPVATALLIPMTAHCTAVLPLDTGCKRLAASLSLHSKHLVFCLSLSRSYLFSQYVNNRSVKAAVIAFPGLCWVAYHVPHTGLGSFGCHSEILERNNLKRRDFISAHSIRTFQNTSSAVSTAWGWS